MIRHAYITVTTKPTVSPPSAAACLRFGRPPSVVDVGLEKVVTVEFPIRNQTADWDPTLVSCHVKNAAREKTQVSQWKTGSEGIADTFCNSAS